MSSSSIKHETRVRSSDCARPHSFPAVAVSAHALALTLHVLAATVALAADVCLRLIPHLGPKRLGELAWHALYVTLVSAAFSVLGVGLRPGLLS